jgi:single-strand DNA-binding protein
MLVVEIIGNLGADAVIKEFNGQKFISFSVAHTESYTDGQGQKHERATWVGCLKYGESAVINYLKKGARVFVRGELSTKIYTANGTTQVGVNCKVRELQLLGGSRPEQQAGGQYQQQQTGAAPSPSYYQPEQSEQFPPSTGSDDLPF